jgi:hypothetical protein
MGAEIVAYPPPDAVKARRMPPRMIDAIFMGSVLRVEFAPQFDAFQDSVKSRDKPDNKRNASLNAIKRTL